MSEKHLSSQFDVELSGISTRVLEMGGLVEAYQEVARRLGIIAEGEKPERTKPKLVKTDLN